MTPPLAQSAQAFAGFSFSGVHRADASLRLWAVTPRQRRSQVRGDIDVLLDHLEHNLAGRLHVLEGTDDLANGVGDQLHHGVRLRFQWVLHLSAPRGTETSARSTGGSSPVRRAFAFLPNTSPPRPLTSSTPSREFPDLDRVQDHAYPRRPLDAPTSAIDVGLNISCSRCGSQRPSTDWPARSAGFRSAAGVYRATKASSQSRVDSILNAWYLCPRLDPRTYE